MLQSYPLIERIMASVLGSFATLMAIRLSLISDIDLATKWVLGVMASLVVFAIIVNRFRPVAKDS